VRTGNTEGTASSETGGSLAVAVVFSSQVAGRVECELVRGSHAGCSWISSIGRRGVQASGYGPYRAMMPPERVRMPMAPTFCLRRVFWTPATTAPTAVVWSMVLTVLERASRGWKVACWSAMGGGMGRRCRPGSSLGVDGDSSEVGATPAHLSVLARPGRPDGH
jgi:hypothetical protein